MQPDKRPGRSIILVADALAVDDQGRIPLVMNQGSWWLPGGRVEARESFIDAAVRETAEETSLSFDPEGIVRIAQMHLPDRHVVFVTVRGRVSGELHAPEGDDKVSEVRWATTAQARELVSDFDWDALEAPVIQEEWEEWE